MTVYFHTLGCKVNQYETQAMRRLMENEGWETGEYASPAASPDERDDVVVVVNSCTVTGESDRKLRQLLRRMRREYPAAVLVLTGCMPQAFPDIAARFSEADIVLGNAARRALPSHIHRFLTLGQRIVDIAPHGKAFEPLQIDEFQGRTRAFVKIEDGCDRFCSYCIIPYARGRVRSKQPEALRAELEGLAKRGVVEVVLVGINLNAYGREWGGSLADAAELACAVPGIRRVRLGSLEPEAMTSAVVERLAALPALCPQFHLSLQSGCGATLRRMNRHYTPEEYAAVCGRLREAFPDAALTTDVMVGFPGETEEEFAESLAFVRGIGFARTHIFAYSPRRGTPAATAPGQVARAEKAARSRRMEEASRASRDAYLDRWMGRDAEVLLETRTDGGLPEGYTRHYLPVRVRERAGKPLVPGQTVTVRLTSHRDGVADGEPT